MKALEWPQHFSHYKSMGIFPDAQVQVTQQYMIGPDRISKSSESLLPARMKIRSKMKALVSKPDFCICENKDADQLRGNREADQRLCFRYTDSTIPLLPKSEISSF